MASETAKRGGIVRPGERVMFMRGSCSWRMADDESL